MAPEVTLTSSKPHLQRGQLREQHPLQIDPLLEKLWRVEHVPTVAHLLVDRETNVEDLRWRRDLRVVLDIDDEDVVLGRRDDGRESAQKEAVERGKEASVVDGIQTDCQTVVKHVVGDESHEQATRGLHNVDTVCNKR